MFVSPMPTEDEIAELYQQDCFYEQEQKDRIEFDMEPEVKEWEEPRYTKQLKKVIQYTSVGKVLDIGCGYGAMLRVAQAQGWHTYGLELSKRCVELCNNKWQLNVQQKDIFQANYPDNYFNLIIMDNVLEHMVQPDAVLNEVRRILAHQGVLLISVPNILGLSFRCWFVYIKMMNIQFEPKTYGHVFFYTMSTIKFMLKKHGFIIKEAYTDQAPHLGKSKGLERMLKKIVIYIGKHIPGCGNQITVYAMKK
jgi:2-polyprenyl-3-methyl-5-hydroxy-6-metoxy-1,4-benzoquinol methylase